MGQSSSEDDSDGESSSSEEEQERQFPKGAILHLEQISSDTTREDIKAALNKYDITIAFVDFNKGDQKGWLRLDSENVAIEVALIVNCQI